MKIRQRHAGFTFIELAMVLAIIGLLMVFFLGTASVFISNKARDVTRARIQSADAALALYVAANKRLPCPAVGTSAFGTASAGVEQRDSVTGLCTLNQNDGVLPWVTLGIPAIEAKDGWDILLTYRVFSAVNGLTITSGMDMSYCDPAGTALAAIGTTQSCDTGCTKSDLSLCTSPSLFLVSKGFQIEDIAGNVLMSPAVGTGAAYIVISHAEAGGGGYSDGGVFIASMRKASGTREALNANNRDVQTTYIDNQLEDAETTSHFDDLVSRPSISSVAYRAYLAARSH